MEAQPQKSPAVAPMTSGLAIASFVLGMVGLVLCFGPLAGIPGVILGILALGKIGGSGGELSGKGFAVAGIVTGSVSMLVPFLAVMAALLLPALARARQEARRMQCLSNLKQIGLACHMYAQENNGNFPERLSQLYPQYAPGLNLFKCPTADYPVETKEDIDSESTYVLVSGLKSTDRPETVLVHEKVDSHHGDGGNVLHVDGHVKWVLRAELEVLLSEPALGF